MITITGADDEVAALDSIIALYWDLGARADLDGEREAIAKSAIFCGSSRKVSVNGVDG